MELSPAKQALLELRLKQKARASDHDRIPKRDPDIPAPLSFPQELLWLRHQIDAGAAYNVPRVLQLQGPLIVDVLREALRDLVTRHEVLRTRIVDVNGQPMQIVDKHVDVNLETVDLRSQPDDSQREREVMRLIEERACHRFHLGDGPLMKSTLLRLGPEENILVMVVHHIASDVWSRHVLYRDLAELYDSRLTGRTSCLPELPIQYADYATWQRSTLQGDVLRRLLDYWKDHHAGASSLAELPIDFTRPQAQSFNGSAIRRHLLSAREQEDLKALGFEQKATVFMTTLACVKALLFRLTGQPNIVVGTPIAGRDRAETEDLLGYFSNTLALRTVVAGDMTFSKLLQQVRKVVLGGFEHQDAPYVEVFAELSPERTRAYNPIFQVFFGYGLGASAPFKLTNVTATPFGVDRGISKFDLSISVHSVETGLLGELEYNTNLFKTETIELIMVRLERIIKGVLAAPDIPISQIDIDPQPAAILATNSSYELTTEADCGNLHGRLTDSEDLNGSITLRGPQKAAGVEIESRALSATIRADASASIAEITTPTEDMLARIWEEVLGVRRIGVNTNFFELSGHSLLAIRLLSRIRNEFVVGISLAEMLSAPTVKAMAALLDQKERGAHGWSSLVPLQPQGDRPPLFCGPVGGGSAFYYRAFAAHIGSDQPLYTFEPEGMNGVDEPQETVEEMAAYYLTHLRAVQPRGPYFLCGLSFGGIVAFEMARQLREAGDDVRALILFDTRAPGYAEAPNRFSRATLPVPLRSIRHSTRFHLENLSVCSSEERLQYVRHRIVKLGRKLVVSKGRLWKLTNENPISLELPEIFKKVKSAEARARANYHPKRYPGHLLLLLARYQPHQSGSEPNLGWDRHAEKLTAIVTPGTHFSLLEEPCVRTTVVRVRAALLASGKWETE